MSEPITRARLAGLAPLEAAALWQVQRDHGMPVEAGLFDEWLQRDQSHREAWDAVSSAWSLFDDADDPTFAALRSAALADRPTTRWYKLHGRWPPAAAAAAVVLAIIGGGVQVSRHVSSSGPQIASNVGAASAMQVYETSSGGRDLTLPDGTRMALGPATRVRVLVTASHRQVELDRGAVTLAVAHDTARPFQVAAFDRRIIDIGTRFQVALEDGAMRVALYEGAVRIEGGSKTAVLRPGEQLIARSASQDVITRIPANDAGGTDLIEFNNVTLAAAAETINQGSAVKLAVPDPAIAHLRVSGRFRAGDPRRFAQSVAVLLSLRMIQVAPNRVELRHTR